jgi:hypothetical protein
MTKFTKANLHFDGLQLTFGESQFFVARFKNGGSKAFVDFLIKNFTVEEYFASRHIGMAPLEILQSKGYIVKR